MKKTTRKGALTNGVLMLFVLFVVAQDVSAQVGTRQGGGVQGGNMVDENGDGVINREDTDHEKQYVNGGGYSDGMMHKNQVQNRNVAVEDGAADDSDTRGQQVQLRAQEPGMGAGEPGAGTGQMQQKGNGTATGGQQAENRVQKRTNNPDVGEQVWVMAHEQVQRQDAIEENVQSAQRSGMAKFFMGADKEQMNVARQEMNQYGKDLEQMKGLYAQGELAPEEALQVKNQIREMEQVQNQLNQQIEEGDGFSLFGWLAGLTS